ncbi:Cyclin-U2-2 [Gracilariopsis chorda]|uniref:Cyclin-U2-2 n=1 Tax=Gracilariopsis chorda TaxID=448386 RepID=A0A2V3J1G6_9FLOR|nr:Cyclin-U2-2 [Gracilariopsis chorda]|eukprot:PXF48228.1 Cyclin-U2-2 [Gracilariopsis chorda]
MNAYSSRHAVARKRHWLAMALEHLSPEQRVICSNSASVYAVHHAEFEPSPQPTSAYSYAYIGEALSNVLQRTCDRNGGCVLQANPRLDARSTNMFYNSCAAPFSLSCYVFHLLSRLKLSRSVYVVALIYLDRVRLVDQKLCLTHMNVHRILATALCLADKYVEDESHRNNALCCIMGMSHVAELNAMEAAFLHRIQWNCWVSEHTFCEYEHALFGRNAPSPPHSSSAPAPADHAHAAVALHTAAVDAARTLSMMTSASGF